MWTGLIIALCAALVVIFGVKGIARVCTTFVPLMALLYVLGCLYILFVNGSYVGEALRVIVESAFDPKAAGGGFVGGAIIMTARYGIARGLFSNESGMGSAPIVAAAAQTRNPVRQALVSSTGTFWDTVVICALTGLVLVSSILAYPDITYNDGAILSKQAFDKIPYIGTPLLTFGIITIAFSTILGWCYYGEKAMEYLKGKKWMLVYRAVFIVAVFIGAVAHLSVVWNLADIANALMAIPNMISLIFLSGIIAKETQKYLWEDRLDEVEEPNNDN
jgi:AGCS family alanine or glycine:cation symporter